MHFILATNWFFDPIVSGMGSVLNFINSPIHNLGLSLVILAALLRLVFWPLNQKQFKSMIAMQKIAPKIKKIQEKFKGDPQKLQSETMAAYKEAGANPLSGCLPILIQYPFLFSVFYLVNNNRSEFENQNFLWIGSAISQHSPVLFGVPVFAASLAHMDVILLVLYAVSMYITVRYGSMPATDPQQAQTQKMMSFMSPLMLGFFGFKYAWPSALTLYWLASNVFTMAQQFYLLRKYHEPLDFIDSAHVITDVPSPTDNAPAPKAISGNGSQKKKTKGSK